MRENMTNSGHPITVSPVLQHRKQMLWQVWVPLGVSIVIVLALAILSIVGAVQGSPQVEHWGNISAIFVIIPVLLSGLVSLVLVGGVAFGITWLLKRMPAWLLKAQLFMIHLSLTVRRSADAATKPVMKVNTLSARVSTLWDRFIRRKKSLVR